MPIEMCIPCAGSGKVLGGGMIIKDCDNCAGRGKIITAEDDIDYLLAKDSERYQEAKKNIMSLDKDIDETKAEKLLDEELVKLKDQKEIEKPKEPDNVKKFKKEK